jgi:short-subunit dehydrogenase
MNDAFREKLFVITGGSSGIGYAVAEALVRRRARVVILSLHRAQVEHAMAQLGGRSSSLDGYACDIGAPADVTAICAAIVAAHGVPDVVVNNAGFAVYRTFEQTPDEEIEQLMNVNFAGAIRVTKAFLGGMIDKKRGQIVNVASIGGAMTITPNAIYCGAKHGMVAWSRCLAIETARYGIHVGVVCPGRVETSFFDHVTFQQRKHRKETELTVPLESVVGAILDTIDHRRRIRFVPRYLGMLAWAAQALGPLVRAPLERLSRARIEDLYPENRG